MNVPELYAALEEIKQETDGLPVLSLQQLDISLQIDQSGRVLPRLKPAQDEARVKVAYENLWGKLSEEMFVQAKKNVLGVRCAMGAWLLQAAQAIQKELLRENLDGPVSFWRVGSSWLAPMVHVAHFGEGAVCFVDAVRAGNGKVVILTCNSNLTQMPGEFQADFISNYWDNLDGNIAAHALYSYDKLPLTDDRIQIFS